MLVTGEPGIKKVGRIPYVRTPSFCGGLMHAHEKQQSNLDVQDNEGSRGGNV